MACAASRLDDRHFGSVFSLTAEAAPAEDYGWEHRNTPLPSITPIATDRRPDHIV